jgi:hypothetical protein
LGWTCDWRLAENRLWRLGGRVWPFDTFVWSRIKMRIDERLYRWFAGETPVTTKGIFAASSAAAMLGLVPLRTGQDDLEKVEAPAGCGTRA